MDLARDTTRGIVRDIISAVYRAWSRRINPSVFRRSANFTVKFPEGMDGSTLCSRQLKFPAAVVKGSALPLGQSTCERGGSAEADMFPHANPGARYSNPRQEQNAARSFAKRCRLQELVDCYDERDIAAMHVSNMNAAAMTW